MCRHPDEVEDALELIEVDYDPLTPVVSIDDALGQTPTTLRRPLGNLVFEAKYAVPGTDRRSGAAHVFADTFSSSRLRESQWR